MGRFAASSASATLLASPRCGVLHNSHERPPLRKGAAFVLLKRFPPGGGGPSSGLLARAPLWGAAWAGGTRRGPEELNFQRGS